MRQESIHMLRGQVAIEVEGAYPERFLNLMAQEHIAFWALDWRDETCFRIRIFRQDQKKAERLAQRAMCELRILERKGAPYFAGRLRHRYALLAGLGLFLVTAVLLSRVILVVEVTGNEAVPTERIEQELRAAGVRFGVYGPSLDVNQIKHAVLLQIEELSWLTVNLTGIRAEVIVREREEVPEILDKSKVTDIVAELPGVITRMEVFEGAARVAVGSTVAEGDVLVSGAYTMEGAQWSNLISGERRVHAMAHIYARTWRTITMETPLTVTGKDYTGSDKTCRALIVGNKRINFYQNSGISYVNYDKLKEMKTFTLPGGIELPVAIVKETLREYEPAPITIDRQSAQTLLREKLEAALRATIGEEGTVQETDFTVEERSGLLLVTLTAACEERIDRTVELAP